MFNDRNWLQYLASDFMFCLTSNMRALVLNIIQNCFCFSEAPKKKKDQNNFSNVFCLPVAPVNRVLMSSLLLVKFVSHPAHAYNLVPFMWSKNMRPIFFCIISFLCCVLQIAVIIYASECFSIKTNSILAFVIVIIWIYFDFFEIMFFMEKCTYQMDK